MIEVRLAKAQDASFIYATWLRSYRHSSQFAKNIPNEVYFKYHHMAIDRIAERGGRFYVAHALGDPDTILGFICSEGPTLVHYCYIKKPFRAMGIARKLVQMAGISEDLYEFTHMTHDMEKITKKRPKLIYNPYGI